MASSPPASLPAPLGAAHSHQALYRRWRAQTFGQIVGQTAVVETLRNAVRLDRLAHGFLFVGPRGTGKTSMARILAKAVNCTDLRDGEPCDACLSCTSIREGRALDVIELDAASNNKVDDMRELLPRVYTSTSDLRRKVFIIDEVQRIKEGWDVLLKTLEEPPDNVLFVFCTTNAAQIRPAVVSRLQRFQFRPLTVPEITGKLTKILDADDFSADADAIELIAGLAAGGMRDAESMLDQVLSSAGDSLDAHTVRDLLGLAELVEVDAFIEALATGRALPGIEVLDRLEASGRDLVAFADQVIARLRQLIVDRLAGRPTPGGLPIAATPNDLARAARRLTGLDANRSTAASFRFQLELALFQEAHASPATPAGDPAVVTTHASTLADRPAGRTTTPAAPTSAAPARRVDAPPTGSARSAAGVSAPDEARHVAGAASIAPEGSSAAPAAGRAPQVATTPSAAAPMVATVPVPPADGPSVGSPSVGSPSADRAPGDVPPAGAPAGSSEASAAPASVAPTPAGSPAAASTADAALDELRRAWPDLVAVVSRNPASRPLIDACRPLEVRDGIAVLGFPEDKAFLREKAESRKGVFEDAIRNILGRPMGVRFIKANLEALEPPAEDVDLIEQARRIFGGDVADVAEVR